MKKKGNKSRKLAILKAKIRGKEKGCAFCKSKTIPGWVDGEKLGEYLSARSRIMHRQFTGICVSHQRKLTKAIKQARHLGLLPFVTR